MALFDSIISGASEKLGLGDKAGTLLSTLLALITNQETGGFSGFIDRFKEVGLGDTATSWITSGDNAEISNEQIESAIGEDTINTIAEQVGIDKEKTTSALAFMTPKVVDNLTPDGEIPDNESLLSKIGGFLTGIGGATAGVVAGATDTAGAVASGAADKASDAVDKGKEVVGDAADAVSNVAGTAADKVGDTFDSVTDEFDGVDDGGSILKWLLPLILLGILIAIGFYACGKDTTLPTTNTNTNTEENVNTNVNKDEASGEAVDSSFKIVAADGKYTVTGLVKDEETKKQIMEKLTAELGEGNVNFDGLTVDANAKDFGAGWWDNFGKLLPNLKDWKTGTLAFVGSAVTEAEGLSDTVKAQLKSLFGEGWTLPVSIVGEADAAKQANEDAAKQLASADSVEEVVKALNISIINFPTGSADIPADAKVVLEKAAEILKKQSEGTVIEIGGHTDNQGNPAGNKTLSQKRADSVKKALVDLNVKETMLKAVGYGDTKPVGDNNTEDGRTKNRRIEYKTASGDAPTATEDKPAESGEAAGGDKTN